MKILYGKSALVRGALAGAVAVGLGVSGCSKNIEPEAGKTPTPTASKSATPTPTPTPTRTPAPTPTAPTGSVEEQLHAATVNFYAVLNEAYKTLDTRPVDEVLLPGSNAASGYTDFIHDVKKKNQHFTFEGGYKISNFEVKSTSSKESTRVEFDLDHGPGQVRNTANKVVMKIPQTPPSRAWIVFSKRGNKWLVVGQDFLDG
ncbi:hypothetical protein SAMN05421678_11085 [Actinopolymorpha cephalotaxi]|uniref:Uncharacterized protein n=1 Tax=Actinopolymorpha cephalotaxi TaxID=504797 RepID=A0A1I2W490_9ACTN|nr:hypothetical protein [Actinopolymorpha cephalotaxi]NYH82761.1 hypothetical protein [Actinopolymorpha cephalotaxi]SFG96204.1 hypothetical protein SAMN05421678_11085 [Actinopolymorpha cephalotaxi]